MDTRLATYNVKCFPWSYVDIDAIVEWLTQSADIVALQEVWCRHAAWVTAFEERGWVFLRPPRETHIAAIFGSGLAVAWNSRKFALDEFMFYPYLSTVGFDSWVTKGWFRLDMHTPAGFHFRLINTHMQSEYEICDSLFRHVSEPIRMAQSLQLVSTEVQVPASPTLIVGDMNTETCWLPRCKWLVENMGVTFPNTEQTLDHCACWRGDRWQVMDYRVASECKWSDHWPVLWRLRHSI